MTPPPWSEFNADSESGVQISVSGTQRCQIAKNGFSDTISVFFFLVMVFSVKSQESGQIRNLREILHPLECKNNIFEARSWAKIGGENFGD